MLALTVLSIFILIIVLIIVVEYKNEKKYQAKRHSEAHKKKKPRNKLKVKKVAPKPKVKEKPIPEPTPKPKPTSKPEPIPEPIVEIEIPKETKELPEVKYPKFSHARLVDMGLSDDEAVEFVQELIPQLELQIPLVEEAMNIPDFHQMERLTHSIKGSATNIGTGGVSDLLVECNTYLKSGTDIDIAKVYFEALKHYTQELKTQYT